MRKLVKIVTGILGFIMLVPGLAKFGEPFKTFIYKHLTIIGFPFPDFMQYVVKFSEVGVGLLLIYVAFRANKLNPSFRNKLFYLGNITVVGIMIVAVYTHLHLDVPAEILPMETKPPYMPIGYIFLVAVNLFLNRNSN
ncbi:hypothetical protein SAMN05444411_10163 [Lutibacter oricola]|uniref:DoxX-like family protein n=1 Tax=Lutibacter oricola TaxID=762486 RepID=A0A1H2QT24_9FLAO|nr:hypothetical protein [Lutibacter oricola]SDW09589.1 hypothetical protein SAMN05444411_10163 [Lutibacter oricola]